MPNEDPVRQRSERKSDIAQPGASQTAHSLVLALLIEQLHPYSCGCMACGTLLTCVTSLSQNAQQRCSLRKALSASQQSKQDYHNLPPPVQFSSRWYLCAWKSPYALHPVSQKFPQRCLWNGSSVHLIMMALSRPFKEDHLVLPLSTPLSSRRSMVWCPWLCASKPAFVFWPRLRISHTDQHPSGTKTWTGT